jgi:CheY-like chemotaxis protein
MMNGRIWVESKIGKGSTFHFTAEFDLDTESKKISDSRDLSQLADLPVLVVDDNPTNRRIFEEILKGWHVNLSVVSDSCSALDELKQAAEAGQPYRIVLMDCMMPEMDGFDLAECICADRSLDDCVMIMASSGACPDHAELCRKYRISRYLLKPVVQSELLQTILDVLGATESADASTDSESQAESLSESPPDQQPKLDILLVEDGLVNQKVALGMLEAHNVEIAQNGQEAIERLEMRDFDLVLMDVQMPVLDGLEATVRIREKERGTDKRIPIIAMTASAMKGDRERCLEAGMNGYIAKPITREDLSELVDRYASARTSNMGGGS